MLIKSFVVDQRMLTFWMSRVHSIHARRGIRVGMRGIRVYLVRGREEKLSSRTEGGGASASRKVAESSVPPGAAERKTP